MTQPARVSITKNPINITQFEIVNAEDPAAKELKLSWQFTGEAPRDGWLLLYTVDGAATPSVIQCDGTSAVIAPRIPGATYRFTLQSANGTSVLNNLHSCVCPDAETFNQNGLPGETVTAQLLKTPENKNWRYDSISDSDFTDTFAVGESISVVLRAESPFYLPGTKTWILYVYTDPHGNVLFEHSSQEEVSWKSIWSGGDAKTGELDVPSAPDAPGTYLLNIYMDGMSMAQIPLTIQ